jgi:mannitol-1-phosphate 5-dehydrogenase
MRAVAIGPGRIGLGFAGDLLDRADCKLAVVGRGDVIENLERTGRYRLRLVDADRDDEREVRVHRALSIGHVQAVAAEIARARVLAVAVGPANLTAIAPVIAAGLRARRRKKPLNVIAFENAVDAGPRLRAAVAALLPAGFPLERHGFSGAVVGRAVSRRVGDPGATEPLTFVGDSCEQFAVHGPSLRKPLPKIPGLTPVPDFEAAFNAKLYVFSAGHATVAYLGFLKGYRYIHAAARDPEIRAAALAAMREGQEGLAACYGQDLAGGDSELEAILARFENAALADRVVRVARDPRRKLRPTERLVGAARLCEAAGVPTSTLPLAAAAAVCFATATPPGSMASTNGQSTAPMPNALRELCLGEAETGFSDSVTSAWEGFSASWRRDTPLFSLTTPKA